MKRLENRERKSVRRRTMRTPWRCLLLCVGLTACACSATPERAAMETNAAFRGYFEASFTAQVINRNAPADATPVEGYPGEIAAKAYQDFKDGFGEASFEEQVGQMQLGDEAFADK